MSDEPTQQQPAAPAENDAGKAPAGPAAKGGKDKAAKPAKEKGKDKPAKAKSGKGAKDGKDKKGKKDKGKKDKGKKGEAAAGSLAAHPRAGGQIRRAKGWGALTGFLIAAYFSLKAGVPPEQIGLRALAAGAGGYMLGWACSVMIWRQLVIAEMRAIAERSTPRTPERAVGGDGE